MIASVTRTRQPKPRCSHAVEAKHRAQGPSLRGLHTLSWGLMSAIALTTSVGCGGSGQPPGAAQAAAPQPVANAVSLPEGATQPAHTLKPSDDYLDPPTPPPTPLDLNSQWWNAEQPCPEGAMLDGEAPPGGRAIRCRTPRKVNQGPGTTFFPNGSKKQEGRYTDGFASGVWTFWDQDGKLQRLAHFEAGSEQGLSTEFHPSGGISAQREYKRGARNGRSVLWDEGGNKRLEQPYVDGKKHGVATHWTADGRVLKVELWENDQLLKTEEH